MPVIIDDLLKEQIPYDPAIYPISFYQHELETLPQWSGPFHWHPGFEIATAKPAYWIIRSEINILF